MQGNIISYIPAAIGLVGISVFVWLSDKSFRNKAFALSNIFVALWLVCLFAADLSSHDNVSLWFLRGALFFASAGFLMFYYFTLYFPYATKTVQKRQVVYSLPMLLAALLSLTPLVVRSVQVHDYIAQPVGAGFLYVLTDIVSIAYIAIGAGILIAKLRRSDKQQKKQIQLVLIGLLVALAVNVFTGDILTLLDVNTSYVDFGGFSILLFSIFVAYAMIRHGFLDLRLIVARAMGYLLSLTVVAAIYSVVIFGIISRFLDISHLTVKGQELYVVLAVFVSFTFPPIKRFFDRLSNRIFFRDAYDSQALLDEFNKILVSNFELEPLLVASANLIQANLKLSYCMFVVNGINKGERQHVIGTSKRPSVDGTELQFLEQVSAATHEDVILTDELEPVHAKNQKMLRQRNMDFVVRLSSQDKNHELVGYLVLGGKKSGDLYTSQDVRIIEIIANELVIAVQNALRTEEIRLFNETLQGEIRDATKRLRHSNERLKVLDETKDDFISMASHQLRTPLTSVKGYISMVLDGDAGPLNDNQRKLLEQSFRSSQQMVYLISDLLNLSRLNTGKFVIEPTPVKLSDTVQFEVSQLDETAKARDITLVYDKPASFPTLMLDETKIHQVIMNFMDNAIYYTRSGGTVTVALRETASDVEFTVTDTGIGVPKHVQHKLFTKFYRADNAQKARPDGTGLGLFMAKKVIAAQGGVIIFESEEGKGSTFGFRFNKNKLAAAKE